MIMLCIYRGLREIRVLGIIIKLLLFIVISMSCSALLAQSARDLNSTNSNPVGLEEQRESELPSEFYSELYSETIYDQRINGATTDSRIRLGYQFLDKRFKLFTGGVFSRDLTNGSAPQAIQNAFSPSLGAVYSITPWFGSLIEKRWNYLTESISNQDYNHELRYGFYGFNRYWFDKIIFAEIYGELISIDRVSSIPVFTLFSKFGLRALTWNKFSTDFYLEPFTRQSPHPGYGPIENEFRIGTRLNLNLNLVQASILIHHSAYSNTKPGGWDALLVLSGGRL